MNKTLIDESFYTKIGSPSIIFDNIQIYFFAPYSIICILTNLISFIVVQDKSKCNHTIYKYFRISISSSTFLCLLVFLNIFTRIPRYSSFSYSYLSRLFSFNIMFNLIITFYSFTNIIDSLSLIHRLSNFVIKFQSFKNMKTYKISFYCFMFFLIINMPLFFMYKTSTQEYFEQNKYNLEQSDICMPSTFGKSVVVQTIYYIVFTIDNLFTLTIEIVMHLIHAFYFKKFLNTNFALRNINTADRIFKSIYYLKNKSTNVNENNNITTTNININTSFLYSGSNVSEIDQNAPKLIKKFPYFVPIYFLVLNTIHFVLSFIILTSQTYESRFIYGISVMIIYLCVLVKHGHYIIFLTMLDHNFKTSLAKCTDLLEIDDL